MAELLVLYKTPKDPRAFDKYYFEIHVPLAKKIPGLRKYTVSRGTIGTPAGPSGLYLVGTLTFDSVGDIQAAFASPQGQAAAADVPNFATGGAELHFFDTREV